MARYALSPVLDQTNQKWRLNIPALLSVTGKRQRLWFSTHSEALAEAQRIRRQYHEYGLSAKMLPRRRLNESEECWELLDKASSDGPAGFGTLRRIVIEHLRSAKQRERSISLDQLFDQYVEKLTLRHKTANYLRQVRYVRHRFRYCLDWKLPDLTAQDIDDALYGMPSGNRNSFQSILRTVLNFAVRKGHLSNNPALAVEFVHRERPEIKALSNEVVEAMLRDAATNNLELLPAWTIAFFTGVRESELFQLRWEDVHLNGDGTGHVLIRAEVSKTRRKRYPELPSNAIAWLNYYLVRKGDERPESEERVLRAFTTDKLHRARTRNYRAALNNRTARWPINSKRRTFATNYLAAYEDYGKLALTLGHTDTKTSIAHYVGGTTKALGLAYFDIRPTNIS